MLIFQIKRIISSEKWFNFGVTSSPFFFLKMPNILGRSDDAKRRTIYFSLRSFNFSFPFPSLCDFRPFRAQKNLLSGPFITLKWKQISLGSFSKIRLDIQSILMYAWSLSFFNFKTNSSFLETTISERAY